MIVDRYVGVQPDNLKRDRGALLAVLKEAAGAKDLKIRGNSLCCAFCSDSRPSAGVFTNGDGSWRFKCQRDECGFGGDIIDIIARADGIDVSEVFRRLRGVSKAQTQPKVYKTFELLKAAMPYPIEDIYHYTDPATGKADMYVFRLKTPEDKKFIQAKPVPGGFVQQAPAPPRPLYNRKRLQSADMVIVVEGEKCVHILHKYEVISTTSPGGKGSASHADWTPLKGKRCILWPDANGIEYMQDVAGILQRIAASVHIINPADLGLTGKDDVEQYIQRQTGDISSVLVKAFDTAKAVQTIADSIKSDCEDIWSGKTQVVPWPWTVLTDATQALVNGKITILCGEGGSTKSLTLMQALAFWHDLKIKVAVLELENDRNYHLMRAVAQVARDARVASVTKIKEAEDEIRAILDRYTDFLNSFGKVVYECPDDQLLNLEYVANWIEARAKEGNRIIAIDPVTVIRKTKEPWIADNAFLLKAHKIAKQYRCSIILATHPTKTFTNPDMGQLAGGADYARQAKCILWLQYHHNDTKTGYMSYMGQPATEVEYNLTLHILKASDSWGAGTRIGYNFQKESLTLREEGIIQKKDKK